MPKLNSSGKPLVCPQLLSCRTGPGRHKAGVPPLICCYCQTDPCDCQTLQEFLAKMHKAYRGDLPTVRGGILEEFLPNQPTVELKCCFAGSSCTTHHAGREDCDAENEWRRHLGIVATVIQGLDRAGLLAAGAREYVSAAEETMGTLIAQRLFSHEMAAKQVEDEEAVWKAEKARAAKRTEVT